MVDNNVRCYRIPYGILPVSIIEVGGVFYSFGCTTRSFTSIWREVETKLESLNTIDFTEVELKDVEANFVGMLGDALI